MDKVWPWITNLPNPSNWPSTDSPISLPLAATSAAADNDAKSILLTAQRTAGSDAEPLITISISLHGFHPSTKTLWLSNPFPLSSPTTHLLLLLQLLQELISLSPSTSLLPSNNSPITTPFLDPDSVLAALANSSKDAAALPAFFTLSLLCRLFYLCALDAPADAGFLFFHSLDNDTVSVIQDALADCKPALRRILLAVGADWEERFARAVGYMVAKWCILRELQSSTGRPIVGFCPSYAANSLGLWVLKGYAPIPAMARVGGAASAVLDAKDSVLRYALAHQQLEVVVQLEYNVCMKDPRFIRISVRVDNIRLHVVRLGFRRDREEKEAVDIESERHFPSRVRVWVGPERGSACVTGISLGRSTDNPERELEMVKSVKGRYDHGMITKFPAVKAKARAAVRSRGRSWRWEQEAEGSAGVFEGVLCDGSTGEEVVVGGGGGEGMRGRYGGMGRVFSKGGGLVVGGDEVGEGLSWRVGWEMEGRVLKWRIGGKVWVSYLANEVKSRYYETRCVEWEEDVELALVA